MATSRAALLVDQRSSLNAFTDSVQASKQATDSSDEHMGSRRRVIQSCVFDYVGYSTAGKPVAGIQEGGRRPRSPRSRRTVVGFVTSLKGSCVGSGKSK